MIGYFIKLFGNAFLANVGKRSAKNPGKKTQFCMSGSWGILARFQGWAMVRWGMSMVNGKSFVVYILSIKN
jgi:hypothetical protein